MVFYGVKHNKGIEIKQIHSLKATYCMGLKHGDQQNKTQLNKGVSRNINIYLTIVTFKETLIS